MYQRSFPRASVPDFVVLIYHGYQSPWHCQTPSSQPTSYHKITTLALLARSPKTSVQNVSTEIIIVTARPVLSTPAVILKSQVQSRIDWGVWGHTWIAKYTVPKPEGDRRDVSRTYVVKKV